MSKSTTHLHPLFDQGSLYRRALGDALLQDGGRESIRQYFRRSARQVFLHERGGQSHPPTSGLGKTWDREVVAYLERDHRKSRRPHLAAMGAYASYPTVVVWPLDSREAPQPRPGARSLFPGNDETFVLDVPEVPDSRRCLALILTDERLGQLQAILQKTQPDILRQHSGITALAALPGRLAVGRADGSLDLVGLGPARTERIGTFPGWVTHLTAVGPDRIVAGGTDRRLRAWDFANGQRPSAPSSELPLDDPPLALAALPDGGIVCSTAGREPCVRVWSPTGQQGEQRIGLPWPATALAVLGANRVAAGCWDGQVRVLDLAGGRVEEAWPGTGCRVTALAAPGDGSLIVADERATLHRWAPGSSALLAEGDEPIITLVGLGGNRVAGLEEGGRILVWKAAGFTSLQSRGIALAPTENGLAIADERNRIQIHDPDTGEKTEVVTFSEDRRFTLGGTVPAVEEPAAALAVIQNALAEGALGANPVEAGQASRALELSAVLAGAPVVEAITTGNRFHVEVPLGARCPPLDRWTYVVLCIGPEAASA